MNREFYEQYYCKGGDYILPVSVFNDLLDEVDTLKNRISDLEVVNVEHQKINVELREEIKGLENLFETQRQREYASKFFKEFQEEHGTNVYPDFDEIYKRYDKLKEENKKLKGELKKAKMAEEEK